MANYYGSARSNYVTIIDREGLDKALAPFDRPGIRRSESGKSAFMGNDPDSGSFTSWGIGENGEDLEFSWEKHVMPYVAEGEVLVIMEAGAEKLRYIVGVSVAFIRRGDKVQSIFVDIESIYKKAAKKFGVPRAEITDATY
jgi:hypothetical protein